MKRLVLGAALAASSLLVHPLQATAQNYEPGIKGGQLLCGHFVTYSFAVMTNGLNTRALCRWKCVWKTQSGQLHTNSGARNFGPGEGIYLPQTRKESAVQLGDKVAGAGSCVEAKDPRKK